MQPSMFSIWSEQCYKLIQLLTLAMDMFLLAALRWRRGCMCTHWSLMDR